MPFISDSDLTKLLDGFMEARERRLYDRIAAEQLRIKRLWENLDPRRAEDPWFQAYGHLAKQ